MHKLDKLCKLVNIINFEYSENFPKSGFTSLIFPIGKALGPLPKIAKKIPVRSFSISKHVWLLLLNMPRAQLFKTNDVVS